MNWDIKTAKGREVLFIQDRKLSALYAMEPNLFADTPYGFFPYMSDDCVLRSEKLPEPLTGQAIRNFLIREKNDACSLSHHIPGTDMVESIADGDILLRIRPQIGDKQPDGELVRLELNRDGKVCLIDRFDENKLQYREFGTSVTLTPIRKVRDGESTSYEKIEEEEVSFSDLYYDEISMIFDLLPNEPQFTEMEERYMEMSDWTAILDMWKKINGFRDYDSLHEMVFRLEEGYLREYRWYAKELEEQIRTVMEKRDPYGIRMQAWLEDWLNSVKDRYDCIWKC